ncbi:MAG TPA: acyl carrier protein [Propionibacteriaceae bacterium]|nr:acyl carrier protein [Propionibacteriaceae bacterium]
MTLPSGKSATLEAVIQDITYLLRADTGAADPTADSTLENLGLDSLKLMSLLFKIEERYEIALGEEDGDDIQTVGDLAALVVRHLRERR